MSIPQELLKESAKKTKISPGGIQAMRLKSAIKKDKPFHLRYNLLIGQLRVFRKKSTRASKSVDFEIFGLSSLPMAGKR
jgi:hypothetical protein